MDEKTVQEQIAWEHYKKLDHENYELRNRLKNLWKKYRALEKQNKDLINEIKKLKRSKNSKPYYINVNSKKGVRRK